MDFPFSPHCGKYFFICDSKLHHAIQQRTTFWLLPRFYVQAVAQSFRIWLGIQDPQVAVEQSDGTPDEATKSNGGCDANNPRAVLFHGQSMLLDVPIDAYASAQGQMPKSAAPRIARVPIALYIRESAESSTRSGFSNPPQWFRYLRCWTAASADHFIVDCHLIDGDLPKMVNDDDPVERSADPKHFEIVRDQSAGVFPLSRNTLCCVGIADAIDKVHPAFAFWCSPCFMIGCAWMVAQYIAAFQ